MRIPLYVIQTFFAVGQKDRVVPRERLTDGDDDDERPKLKVHCAVFPNCRILLTLYLFKVAGT